MSSRKLWDVFFIFACVFAVVAASLWTADPDVFWHLKVGEWIVRHGSVPKVDVYSWSAKGQPWTCHQWLWEVIIYCVHRCSGIYGLWLLVFASAVGSGVLVYKTAAKGEGSYTKAAIAGGIAPIMLMGWLKPWPQAGVYALFAAYLYLVSRERWGIGELLAAGLISLLWANIHSSGVMFPLLLFAEAIWWNLILKKNIPFLWLAFALSGVATLLNPHRAGLWVYAVREGLMSHEYRTYIAEWMPYFFGSPELTASFFISATVILAAAVQNRWRSVEFARACGFWILALMSRIYTPYAVMSTAVLLGKLEFQFSLKMLKATTAAALALGIATLVAHGVPGSLEAAAAKGKYPVGAADYLLSHKHRKVFNDYGFGGYLIWREISVYIDGRADLYRYHHIFLSYIESPKKWNGKLTQFIEKTGADTAMVYRYSYFDRALEESSKWEKAYADDAAALYVKKRT